MIKRLLLYTFLTSLFLNNLHSACLPNWKYNRSITVTNSNASAYTNFQVKVIVNTQALIAAGKMNINGNDIRFTDVNCNNLHYWIDSNLNTTTTVIWVKTNSLISSGNTTIFMYYGNFCATPVQNGDSTFVMFDDFTGNALNTAKWNTYQNTPANATLTVGGGNVLLTANAIGTDNILRTVNTFPSPIRTEGKVVSNAGSYPCIAQLNTGTFNGVSLFTGIGLYLDEFNFSSAIGPSCSSFGSNLNTSGVTRSNGVWGIEWTTTNNSIATFPGGNQTLGVTPALAANIHGSLGLLCISSTASVGFDWYRIRSYAPVEPSTTVNTETDQSVVQIDFFPKIICPGTPIRVIVSKSGIFFNNGNVFTIELSDASGNFGSPTSLGTINDTIPDTLFTDLPNSITNSNLYKIRVTTSSPAYNCYVADANLIVHPKPNASYTFPNDNQCYKYNRYNFTSTSTISSGTIDSFIWRWDDASGIDTAYVPTISHTFRPFYAYYYPILTVVSNLGCRDSASVQVSIRETPDIKTVFNDTIQCFKGNFYTIQSKTELASGTLVFKSFNVGDGTPTFTNIDSFSHRYAADGIYQVTQINEHSNGCIDTNFLAVLVNTHPNAIINTNDTDQCLFGNTFIFESASTITNGLPLLNYWDLDDGITRDMQDSAHISYPTASNRVVSLITISDDGVDGCSDTTSQIILVNPMPNAGINNIDLEKCFNFNSFRFNATSTVSSGTMVHNWNFGDLSTINNDDTVAHTYLNDGSYTVRLDVTTNKGCIDSAFTNVIVNPSPVPSFTINRDTQCFKYNEVKAVSTSTITSGTYTEYWKISDGAFFTDVDSIKHNFAAYGKYEILLELTSNNSCKDTFTDSVNILPMPTSSYLVDDEDQCLEGNIYTFTDNSVFTQGLITGNEWLFGDGNSALNQSPVTHTYITENQFQTGLIVFADNGCFDTSFLNVKVYPHPGSDFIINDNSQCVNDNKFDFSNNTFISEGGFTNRWFFGDGSAYVDGFSVSKKYTKDSTYTVRLVSFSDQGCTDTAEKTVTVFPKAITRFTIDNAQQCIAGNNFNFTSTTTLKSGTYSLAWQYGDGTFAGNVNPTSHSYSNSQQYTVRLISTTNELCKDTAVNTIRTLPMPIANYTFNQSESCLDGNDFSFSSTSTVSNGSQMNFKWYFGDNDSLINSNFAQHSYLTDGAYTVRLIASTNTGACKDTADKIFTVFPMPVASYTVDDDQQCLKDNLFGFNSTSTVSSGTIDINNWKFGDNTTSSVISPSKTYATVNRFRISLTVLSDRGCLDSTFGFVETFPMPRALFTVNPSFACLKGNSFRITNTSSIQTGGVISNYRFDYGNNDSSLLEDPTPYSYTQNGTYTIGLRVTTDRGCWDTTSKVITVNPNPNIDFTVDSVCLKDSSVFVNNTTINNGSITAWKWLFGNGRTSTLQSPKFKYRDTGHYTITLIARTIDNCVDTLVKPRYAIVNPNPKAGFFYTKERSWENEVDIQYTDTSIGAISWDWNFSSMGTSTDQNPKLFYNDTLTQYTTLVVRNGYGCRDTVTKLLFIAPDVIYFMPNAFTPNDDNINETFKPLGLAYAINYKFIIFNRWGEILFSTDNPQIGWDGTYEGKIVPLDLYFYRLEFVGVDELRHEEKGNVMILR